MRVVTFNVNGVRALARKGGVERIVQARADVVCLQEVRATADQMSVALAGRLSVAALAESDQKGRSGVAVLSGHPVLMTRIGLPGFENDGRWVEVVLDTPQGAACFISVYVPKGYVGDPRQERKLLFLGEMTKRMEELRRDAETSGVQVVVGGDLNVARTDLDLKNWKGNRGKSGVLPEEREFLEKWAQSGWADIGQSLAGGTGDAGSTGNPGTTGNPQDTRAPYTWWSQRGRAFDNDAGWRIDYVWATPGLATAAKSAEVDRPPAWDARWSDHAALIVDFA